MVWPHDVESFQGSTFCLLCSSRYGIAVERRSLLNRSDICDNGLLYIFFSAPMWAIAITWRPSSACTLFQKISPLKPLGQFKPNLAWIILRVFPLNVMSDDPADQPSWLPCLYIEHRGTIAVWGNNSKPVNKSINLTCGKNDEHSKIYLPCNFEVNLITYLGVNALFHQFFKFEYFSSYISKTIRDRC